MLEYFKNRFSQCAAKIKTPSAFAPCAAPALSKSCSTALRISMALSSNAASEKEIRLPIG